MKSVLFMACALVAFMAVAPQTTQAREGVYWGNTEVISALGGATTTPPRAPSPTPACPPRMPRCK